jgi:hypothetical protein
MKKFLLLGLGILFVLDWVHSNLQANNFQIIPEVDEDKQGCWWINKYPNLLLSGDNFWDNYNKLLIECTQYQRW